MSALPSRSRSQIIAQIHSLKDAQDTLDEQLDQSTQLTLEIEGAITALACTEETTAHSLSSTSTVTPLGSTLPASRPDDSIRAAPVTNSSTLHAIELLQKHSQGLRESIPASSHILAHQISLLDSAQRFTSDTLDRLSALISIMELRSSLRRQHNVSGGPDQAPGLTSESVKQVVSSNNAIASYIGYLLTFHSQTYPSPASPTSPGPVSAHQQHQHQQQQQQQQQQQSPVLPDQRQSSDTPFTPFIHHQFHSPLRMLNTPAFSFLTPLVSHCIYNTLKLYYSKCYPALGLNKTSTSGAKQASSQTTTHTPQALSELFSLSTSLLKLRCPNLSIILYTNTLLLTIDTTLIQHELIVDRIPSTAVVDHLAIISSLCSIVTETINLHKESVCNLFGYGGLFFVLVSSYAFLQAEVMKTALHLLYSFGLEKYSPSLVKDLHVLYNVALSGGSRGAFASSSDRSTSLSSSSTGPTPSIPSILQDIFMDYKEHGHKLLRLPPPPATVDELSPQFMMNIDDYNQFSFSFDPYRFLSLSYSPHFPVPSVKEKLTLASSASATGYGSSAAMSDHERLYREHDIRKQKVAEAHEQSKNQTILSSGMTYLTSLASRTLKTATDTTASAFSGGRTASSDKEPQGVEPSGGVAAGSYSSATPQGSLTISSFPSNNPYYPYSAGMPLAPFLVETPASVTSSVYDDTLRHLDRLTSRLTRLFAILSQGVQFFEAELALALEGFSHQLFAEESTFFSLLRSYGEPSPVQGTQQHPPGQPSVPSAVAAVAQSIVDYHESLLGTVVPLHQLRHQQRSKRSDAAADTAPGYDTSTSPTYENTPFSPFSSLYTHSQAEMEATKKFVRIPHLFNRPASTLSTHEARYHVLSRLSTETLHEERNNDTLSAQPQPRTSTSGGEVTPAHSRETVLAHQLLFATHCPAITLMSMLKTIYPTYSDMVARYAQSVSHSDLIELQQQQHQSTDGGTSNDPNHSNLSSESTPTPSHSYSIPLSLFCQIIPTHMSPVDISHIILLAPVLFTSKPQVPLHSLLLSTPSVDHSSASGPLGGVQLSPLSNTLCSLVDAIDQYHALLQSPSSKTVFATYHHQQQQQQQQHPISPPDIHDILSTSPIDLFTPVIQQLNNIYTHCEISLLYLSSSKTFLFNSFDPSAAIPSSSPSLLTTTGGTTGGDGDRDHAINNPHFRSTTGPSNRLPGTTHSAILTACFGFEFHLPHLHRIPLTKDTISRSLLARIFSARKVPLSFEDCFYLIHKCSMRSLATSNIDIMLALLNTVQSFLQDEVSFYLYSQLVIYARCVPGKHSHMICTQFQQRCDDYRQHYAHQLSQKQSQGVVPLLTKQSHKHSMGASSSSSLFAPSLFSTAASSLSRSISSSIPGSSSATSATGATVGGASLASFIQPHTIFDYHKGLLAPHAIASMTGGRALASTTEQDRILGIFLACDDSTGLHDPTSSFYIDYQHEKSSGTTTPSPSGSPSASDLPPWKARYPPFEGAGGESYHSNASIQFLASTFPAEVKSMVLSLVFEAIFVFGLNTVEYCKEQIGKLTREFKKIIDDYYVDYLPWFTKMKQITASQQQQQQQVDVHESSPYLKSPEFRQLFSKYNMINATIQRFHDIHYSFHNMLKSGVFLYSSSCIHKLRTVFDLFCGEDYTSSTTALTDTAQSSNSMSTSATVDLPGATRGSVPIGSTLGEHDEDLEGTAHNQRPSPWVLQYVDIITAEARLYRSILVPTVYNMVIHVIITDTTQRLFKLLIGNTQESSSSASYTSSTSHNFSLEGGYRFEYDLRYILTQFGDHLDTTVSLRERFLKLTHSSFILQISGFDDLLAMLEEHVVMGPPPGGDGQPHQSQSQQTTYDHIMNLVKGTKESRSRGAPTPAENLLALLEQGLDRITSGGQDEHHAHDNLSHIDDGWKLTVSEMCTVALLRSDLPKDCRANILRLLQ